MRASYPGLLLALVFSVLFLIKGKLDEESGSLANYTGSCDIAPMGFNDSIS